MKESANKPRRVASFGEPPNPPVPAVSEGGGHRRHSLPIECAFEAEVLAAAIRCRWPDLVDQELRAHVSKCAICSDVAVVAGAIGEALEETRAEISLPDAGRVWWLAQLRARRDAATTAGRPITVAQVLAFACAMGLAGACVGATSTWFQAVLRRLGASLTGLGLAGMLAGHALLAVGLAAVLLLIPAAVWLAAGRD